MVGIGDDDVIFGGLVDDNNDNGNDDDCNNDDGNGDAGIGNVDVDGNTN